MATEPQLTPSFSLRRKWSIGLDVVVRSLVVLAVLAMVNYLSGQYFHRFFLSSQTRIELSSRTIGVLKSLTNQVKVTLYYDKDDPLYPYLASLLTEYQNVNRRIEVATVDYQWDAAAAQRIKGMYKLGESADDNAKNLVIFDCDGRLQIVPGKALADFEYEEVPNEKEREYRRKLTVFNGEKMFTGCILAVSTLKPFRAYYLQGHREHSLTSGDGVSGYMNFATILRQNYVQFEPLSLAGTNAVPMDCNLLIVAGPTTTIANEELEKIAQYLDQGGRLFALFNSLGKERDSGLEGILARWNVIVGNSEVTDAGHSLKGADVVVNAFSPHPVVNPLVGSGLDLIAPRMVSHRPSENVAADAPKVQRILFSSETAVLANEPTRKPARYSLAVAVEKGAPAGVATERGSTRMVVVGDSFFLANGMIDFYSNSDFARLAINWLLERPQLLEGISSQPVTEFRIAMTGRQVQTVRWTLLAAMPGGILALAGLVWLRRRK